MLRIIPFALAAALAIPASAKAWVLEDVVSPENFETVAVSVVDGAIDGCWTNIGEARTYAEDKLSELGYEVRDDDEKVNVRMRLSINSQRNGDECLGSISVELIAPAFLLAGAHEALAVVGHSGGIFGNYDNANLLMLEYVRELIEEMESSAGKET